MVLSRRTRLTVGACIATALAGLLGLAWWLWRYRQGRESPAWRLPRTRAALVTLGLLIVAVGATWRLVVAVTPKPECATPGGPLPANSLTAWVVIQKLATWPESGLGLLYSRVTGAHLCFSRYKNYYVAANANHIIGAQAMNMGDVVLKPGLDFFYPSRESLKALVEHEARHREQWAVGTIVGGPLAFPIAYVVTDFFFPGARNPFERMAGLESGGYTPTGTGPVLGPAQLAVLSALGAIAIATPVVVWRRRDRGSDDPLRVR
jgi:hypothetical protein